MTLEQLFLTVLEISVASSFVILILLLASPILSKRYGPGLRCLLWLVLAVRLMLPFNAPWRNAVRLDLFPDARPQFAQAGLFIPSPVRIPEREPETQEQTQEVMPEQEGSRRETIKIEPVTLLAAVWAAGTAMFLIYHLGAYFHTLRMLRRWSAPVSDGETLDRLECIKRELSVRGEIRLYRSSKGVSPMLVGFARPRIILPEMPLERRRLDFMLRHELWHLKRGDLWLKLLILLANAVHWFNPLVYIMDRRACLDTELACDADVLRGADGGARKEYGYAVLSFIDRGWRCKTPLTSGFYGGKKQMKQRFYNIADTSVKRQGTALFCAAALIIALAGCAVSATVPEDRPAEPTAGATVPEASAGALQGQDSLTAEGAANEGTAGNSPVYTVMTLTRMYRTGGDFMGLCSGDLDEQTVREVMDKMISPSWQYMISEEEPEELGVAAGENEHIVFIAGGESEKADGGTVVDASHRAYAVVVEDPETGGYLISRLYSMDSPLYIPSSGMMWPTDGGFIAGGLNSYPGHTGIDISGVPEGSPVYAAADGTVVVAKETSTGYGKYVIIDHGNGFETLYAHNSALFVSVGDSVTQGQTVAAVGRSGRATGNALHFEVRQNGRIYNPEDFLTVPESASNPPDKPDAVVYTPTVPKGEDAPAGHAIVYTPADPKG